MTKIVIQLLALTAIFALATSHWKANANPAVANEVQKRDQKNFQLIFNEESERDTNNGELAEPTTGTTDEYNGSTESSTDSSNDGSSVEPPSTTPDPNNGAQSQWLSLCIVSMALFAFIRNYLN